MKYKVRNKDGELEFESLQQLEEAVRQGFVEAEDEMLMEGSTEWKSAAGLVQRKKKLPFFSAIDFWVGLAVVLGVGAIWAFATKEYGGGGILTFVLVNVIARITWKASKRKA